MTLRAPRAGTFWLAAALALGLLGACAAPAPISVAPAPESAAALRIAVPAQVMITGKRAEALVDKRPDFADLVHRELVLALRQAGYTLVEGAGAQADVSLVLSVSVDALSASLTTGTWVRLRGELRVDGEQATLMVLTAATHESDAERYFPSIDEAGQRIAKALAARLAEDPAALEVAALDHAIGATATGKAGVPDPGSPSPAPATAK